MPDWDEDSPQLRENLERVLRSVKMEAEARRPPHFLIAKHWHADMMVGLDVPNPAYRGAFRGPPDLPDCNVHVLGNFGVKAFNVLDQLESFGQELAASTKELDRRIPSGDKLSADSLGAVLELCAWAHAEWVRIHPFANGNGRTARLWANHIAMRYGLPPFVVLRPRPRSGYGAAGAAAMKGNWKPTVRIFRSLLDDFLKKQEEFKWAAS